MGVRVRCCPPGWPACLAASPLVARALPSKPIQELPKPGPEFTVLAAEGGQRLHPARLVELPGLWNCWMRAGGSRRAAPPPRPRARAAKWQHTPGSGVWRLCVGGSARLESQWPRELANCRVTNPTSHCMRCIRSRAQCSVMAVASSTPACRGEWLAVGPC
jgi:hypothetical protein